LDFLFSGFGVVSISITRDFQGGGLTGLRIVCFHLMGFGLAGFGLLFLRSSFCLFLSTPNILSISGKNVDKKDNKKAPKRLSEA
jgi:hypothetical protein